MLNWSEKGEPLSPVYGDRYFSEEEGLSESRLVYLDANGIPARFSSHPHSVFTVGELGFGLGINFTLTVEEWLKSGAFQKGKRLIYFSVEKHPVSELELLQIWEKFKDRSPSTYSCFQSLSPECWPRLPGSQWRGFPEWGVELRLWIGDALSLLSEMRKSALPSYGVNAWYLDGFSPAKNPEMWSLPLMKEVARLSAPQATFGTYSSASLPKAALIESGFQVEKVEGFGKKKHRLIGSLKKDSNSENPIPPPEKFHVIGGGIAGVLIAFSLARRGKEVVLWEKEKALGQIASSNPASLLKPPKGGFDHFRHRFHWLGFQATHALWERMGGKEGKRIGKQGELLGWINIQDWLKALTENEVVKKKLEIRLGQEAPPFSTLHAEEKSGVVYAMGTEALTLPEELKTIPVWKGRGQLALFPSRSFPCFFGESYWIPEVGLAGASFSVRDFEESVRAHENEKIWDSLSKEIPTFSEALPKNEIDFTQGKVGFRPLSPDAFPAIGEVTSRGEPISRTWILNGLGSRGLTGSLIGAEHLASLILGELPVLDREIEMNLDPGRHWAREMKKDLPHRNEWWKNLEAR